LPANTTKRGQARFRKARNPNTPSLTPAEQANKRFLVGQ
jgi:hypothetical protein